MTKPVRLQDMVSQSKQIVESTKVENQQLPKDELFELPEFVLNLEFLLSKGEEQFTAESLLEKAFKGQHRNLSQPEQIFVLLKAMEDLEIVAPLEFDCMHCNETNPVAIELVKVMQTSGNSLLHFFIKHKQYILEFRRPDELLTHSLSSPVASIGMFMLQWLEAHNQGEDFDPLKMPISDFIAIAQLFSEKMFGLSFETKFKCAHCKKQNTQEFSVTLDDVVTVLNEI